MKILFFLVGLFLVLVSGCGPQEKLMSLPQNLTTPEETIKIEKEMMALQSEFDELDIKVDLKRVPVYASQLGHYSGFCFSDEKRNPRAIVLDKRLFNLPENDVFESHLTAVLLHEIGHCFFGREHEEDEYESFKGDKLHKVELLSEVMVPVSVMHQMTSNILPKKLRKYYISELVRKDKVSRFSVLQSFIETEIEAPISSGEVKILYPCDALSQFQVEKEEKENVSFYEKGRQGLNEIGLIYRIRKTSDGEDITLKFRSSGEIMIDEDTYRKLISEGLKCEADITYDPLKPKVIHSCSFKTPGQTLLPGHAEFLKMVGFANIRFTELRSVDVSVTKWKLQTQAFRKRPSLEMWRWGEECLLEASAKFEGMENAPTTLSQLKQAIAAEPAAFQGNKTERVLFGSDTY